jgi:hypothetical protein
VIGRRCELELVEEIQEDGEELLDVVKRIFAISMTELVQDNGGIVLLTQMLNLATARKNNQVLVPRHLPHSLEEQTRLNRPTTVADDNRQRSRVLHDIAVNEPVKIIVVDDLNMKGNLLVEEEALYDVGHDRGAAHAVKDKTLELAGLDPLAEIGVESGEVVFVAPEDTLEERVAEHGLETFKTGLHFDGLVLGFG